MNHIAFYQKYRPKTFSDVIGQEYILKIIQNSIKHKHVAHAYIFGGTKGIGKTTIAKIFAKAINCTNSTTGDACEACENCLNIQKNIATDIIELDAASNNGVNEIRSIVDSSKYLPSSLKYKVYIIDEAHMLTTPAWNALLKTIEEAPDYVVFIFATTEIHKIPGTIVSRCQNFEFNRLSFEQISELIMDVSKKENIEIEAEAIKKIYELADGSARDTLSILEQCSMYDDGKVKYQTLKDIFGLADTENTIDLINLMVNKDTVNVLEKIEYFSKTGVNFSQLSLEICLILIDKLVFEQTKKEEILKKISGASAQKINMSIDECIKAIALWQETYTTIKTSMDVRFGFEVGVFKMFEIFANTKEKLEHPNMEKKLSEKVQAPTRENAKVIFEKNNDQMLPEIGEVFKCVERKIQKQTQTLASEKKTITKSNTLENVESIFMGIASKASKKETQTAEEIFKTIKSQIDLPKGFSYLINYSKIVVASERGIAISFKDGIDAELVNLNNKKIEFLRGVVKYFGSAKYIIAFRNDDVKQLAEKFKKLKNENFLFNDLDTSILEKIINQEETPEQLAKRLFAQIN